MAKTNEKPIVDPTIPPVVAGDSRGDEGVTGAGAPLDATETKALIPPDADLSNRDLTEAELQAKAKTIKGDDVPKYLESHADTRLVQFFPQPGVPERWAIMHDVDLIAHVDMTDSHIIAEEQVVERVQERVFTMTTSILLEKKFALP